MDYACSCRVSRLCLSCLVVFYVSWPKRRTPHFQACHAIIDVSRWVRWILSSCCVVFKECANPEQTCTIGRSALCREKKSWSSHQLLISCTSCFRFGICHPPLRAGQEQASIACFIIAFSFIVHVITPPWTRCSSRTLCSKSCRNRGVDYSALGEHLFPIHKRSKLPRLYRGSLMSPVRIHTVLDSVLSSTRADSNSMNRVPPRTNRA